MSQSKDPSPPTISCNRTSKVSHFGLQWLEKPCPVATQEKARQTFDEDLLGTVLNSRRRWTIPRDCGEFSKWTFWNGDCPEDLRAGPWAPRRVAVKRIRRSGSAHSFHVDFDRRAILHLYRSHRLHQHYPFCMAPRRVILRCGYKRLHLPFQ